MKKRIALSALLVAIGLSTTFSYSAPVNLAKNIAQINSSIQKANYRGADEVVYRTLIDYKDNYEVQALAAVSWALQSKLELAQDQIDRLKNIIPKNSDLHFAQGVVFYKRMASSNMEYRTKTDSLNDIAIREFKYALQLNPNNYKAYNALGVMELRNGNVDSARKNIEKALKIAPNYAVAIDNLGTIYLAEGDMQKAEQYFRKAVSVNPNSSTAYYHLAQLEYENGNYSRCLTYINKCLAWKGYSSYAYNLRGDAYRQQGNEAAAIGAYKKAIEITPENLAPYANLANIYETRRDYELAIDLYKTILSINPNSEQTQLKIADLYLEMGKYNEAIMYYEKVENGLRAEALKGLSSAYYALAMNSISSVGLNSDKKLLEASQYLDKVLQQNPNDLELYLAKAKLSALLNCPQESCETLKSIVSKTCNGVDDYLVKGDANLALANYKAGFEDYRRSISLAKTNDEKLYLGELFMFNKLYGEAETVFSGLLASDPSNIIAKNNLAYIKKVRASATQEAENANYFRKRNSMFFEREYLNRALSIDPYDVRANILMGRLNQRQRKYNDAYKNYSIVVNKSNDAKTLTQYNKRLNKVKTKIEKKCAKEQAKLAKEQAKTLTTQEKETVKKIVPVSNVKKEKVKAEKVKKEKEQKVKVQNQKVEKVKKEKPAKVKADKVKKEKVKAEKVKKEKEQKVKVQKQKVEKVKKEKPVKVKQTKVKQQKVKPVKPNVKKNKKNQKKINKPRTNVDYSPLEM